MGRSKRRGGLKPTAECGDELDAMREGVGLERDQGLLGFEQAETRIDRVELRPESGGDADLVEPDRLAQARHNAPLFSGVLVGRADMRQRIGRIAHRAEHGVVISGNRFVECRRRAAILRL